MKNSLPSLPSRKKFLLWSAAILGSASILKFATKTKKKETETVKMLTEDGKLVEIDKELFVSSGTKISNAELQKWIKK